MHEPTQINMPPLEEFILMVIYEGEVIPSLCIQQTMVKHAKPAEDILIQERKMETLHLLVHNDPKL